PFWLKTLGEQPPHFARPALACPMGQRICGGENPPPPGKAAPGGAATRGSGRGTGWRRQGSNLHRTSAASQYRLRCAERVSTQLDRSAPVKLIVFDLDETLTMATFMTSDGSCLPSERETMARVNFESPWVEGHRLDKLRQLFQGLASGRGGQRRRLAVLTRNANAAGVLAVVNLLQVGGLAEFFCAVWTMPWRRGRHNGAFRDEDGEWQYFDPPVDRVHDHKADVLKHVCGCPEKWLPQLVGPGRARYADLLPLKPESIVLVDDQRANFKSPSGVEVMRYCKVARYDANYRSFGLIKDMGGIGAHSDADYDMLKRFVEDPWMCKESMEVRCNQRDFEGHERRNPVQLVVFDFDETLTLATFMPSADMGEREWSEADLREYNFETPWVEGSRIKKLGALLQWIATKRKLAVLTKNEHGAMAVLKLLRIAGLEEHFSVIWTMSQTGGSGRDNGAYRDGRTWAGPRGEGEGPQGGPAPPRRGPSRGVVPAAGGPAEVMLPGPPAAAARGRGAHRRREGELPQLRSGPGLRGARDRAALLQGRPLRRRVPGLRPAQPDGRARRAHDSDYSAVRGFLEAPWDYPYERAAEAAAQAPAPPGGARLQRAPGASEESKAPRRRSVRPASTQ
ncbi:unnamed protein product, partial [Prorocentrum cordatum]